jgi:hypothetical protein
MGDLNFVGQLSFKCRLVLNYLVLFDFSMLAIDEPMRQKQSSEKFFSDFRIQIVVVAEVIDQTIDDLLKSHNV